MARFLKDSDYNSVIDSTDLEEITNGVDQNLLDCETKAIAKLRTKMVQRYDCDYELREMAAYSAATHYRSGERTISSDVITYVKTFDEWDKDTEYTTGDIVTDEDGYVYTAAQNSKDEELSDNLDYWTPMKAIATNNATYWKTGDNRYPLLVEIIIDIALYLLHARINPRNIPELRKERNREALDQLDAWASGTDTAEIKTKDDAEQVGFSIRWGSSDTKQNNFF